MRLARAGALAFLTAFVALFVQVLVHRMVSVKLVNNLAFLVISLTMLGFAFSGVVLSRRLDDFLDKLDDAVLTCAALFALTFLAASAVFYHAPSGGQEMTEWATSRARFVAAFLACVPLALLYAVPFGFAGLLLGGLLSAPALPTRRIYFFDLLGSAAGAFAVIPAIRALGVERSALLACALLVGGAWILTRPARRLSRIAAGLAAVSIFGCATLETRVFEMRYPASLLPGAHPAAGERLHAGRGRLGSGVPHRGHPNPPTRAPGPGVALPRGRRSRPARTLRTSAHPEHSG